MTSSSVSPLLVALSSSRCFYFRSALAQHGDLFGEHLIPLAHPDGIDQYHVFATQFVQHQLQVVDILDAAYRYAQQLAVNA